MKSTLSPSLRLPRIPRPFFHYPGGEHALIDIVPARDPAVFSVQWIFTDPLRFTPDLIRAIDTVIRQTALPVEPKAGTTTDGPCCLRLLLSITYREGCYEVEPALARIQGADLDAVTTAIDRLVERLASLLRFAGVGRARIVHGRN